ncbi:hypothetical protein, partial [Pectobacterium odoriferum]|uniref:hypothetical protein n=1 Tax=Pectobacterium odoriferum TaxID=78398 RepID=UPI001CA4F90B
SIPLDHLSLVVPSLPPHPSPISPLSPLLPLPSPPHKKTPAKNFMLQPSRLRPEAAAMQIPGWPVNTVRRTTAGVCLLRVALRFPADTKPVRRRGLRGMRPRRHTRLFPAARGVTFPTFPESKRHPRGNTRMA